MRRTLIIAVAVMALPAPADLAAQDLWPVSFEASAGRGSGSSSGEYLSNDDGLAGDVLIGVGLPRVAGGRLVAAVGLAVHGTESTVDICLPARDGGCIQRFPQFTVLSALAGWETVGGGARLLTGPARVHAAGEEETIGWHARGGLFPARLGRFGLGLFIRGTLVPEYRADSFRLVAGGVTLRLR